MSKSSGSTAYRFTARRSLCIGTLFAICLVGNSALANEPGDFDGDGLLLASDIDLLARAIHDRSDDPTYDVNNDGRLNERDHGYWVRVLKCTYLGDSNLDGEYNSSDLVQVFAAGEFEDDLVENSTWATGDSNGDFEVNAADFVRVFTVGTYEIGPRKAPAAAVPEPAGVTTIVTCVIALAWLRSCLGGERILGGKRKLGD